MRKAFIAGWVAGFGAAVLALALLIFGPPRFLTGAGEPENAIVEGDPLAEREAEATGVIPVSQTAAERYDRRDISRLSQARQTPVVEAAHRVVPSVVSVNVIRRERVRRSLWDFVPYGYERDVAGLGSGFAIAPGGYVLTNAHVVAGAVEIVVSTAAGGDYPARLIGSDEISDLALLEIESDIPVPVFGDSDDLVIGEPAIAIGNPFGYLLSNAEPTVTAGVISGTGRHILPTAFATGGQEDQTIYADMIQTDASINPGNSGGPLVNADGRVIGVNSAIFSRTGGSEGLGFAIPINRALRIADQLRSYGEVKRAWVGLDVGPTESDRSGRRRGATIARVAPDSPAEQANLSVGMEVVAIRGRPVKSPLDWEAELLVVSPGQTVDVTVRDDNGRERDITLTVEELPSVRAARIEVLEGLELATLTPAIRAERSLTSRAGAYIVGVSDYVTSVTGLREGDLIVQINRVRVETADDVAEMLDYLAGRGGILVFYERDGRLWRSSFRISNED
jgi:serine protease Do